MRLKRILALLCAMCCTITGAAAADGVYTEPIELQSNEVLHDGAALISAETEDADLSVPLEQKQDMGSVESVEIEGLVESAEVVEPSLSGVYSATPKVSASTHKITVDGRAVSPQAYNIDGYNYFKLRDIAFLLNGTSAAFNVRWDAEKDAVNLISKSAYTAVGGEMSVTPASSLRVQTSTSKILLDGNGVSIKGYRINGNNYYKIADLASAIGFIAAFDNATHTVQIKTAAVPEPKPEPKPDKPFVTGVYSVKVNDYLLIRSGPGPEHSILGRFTNGTKIVVDRTVNGWAHIKDEAGKGDRYCSLDYLVRVGDYNESEDINKPDPNPEPNPDPEPEPNPDPEPEPEPKPNRVSHIDGKKTVIIDPGHGGSDIGAHSVDMLVDEKHINLDVSLYLQQHLESAGVHVIMVRDTLEDGSSLSLRKQVMEEYVNSVDLFFSVHHNAANTTARGAEALAQIADRDGGPSKIIGELLLEEYSELGIPIRKVVFRESGRGDDYYYTNRVAASLGIPAVTSEFCFVDNMEDLEFVDSDEDLRAEAAAQFQAIMRYFDQVEF